MYQMIQFQEERLWGAANSIEGMMHVLNETINYTRQRNLFGSTVLDQQVVHFTLAELKTEIEALRALVWQATETYVAGGDVTELASMCKLKVGACFDRWLTNACSSGAVWVTHGITPLRSCSAMVA